MSSANVQFWRDRLQAYLDSEKRILESQEYTIGNGGAARRNRRADLEQIQNGIKQCQDKIELLEAASKPRARRTFRLRPY